MLHLKPGATWGVVAASPDAVGPLQAYLDTKKKEMASLGAKALEAQPDTAETASAVAMRHAGEHATLRTVAEVVEQGLTMALRIAVWWSGSAASPAVVPARAEFTKDFFALALDPARAQVLMTAAQAGLISSRTFYLALQRGDVTRPGVSWEQEQTDINNEGGAADMPNAARN
jgi:hypothetical protein